MKESFLEFIRYSIDEKAVPPKDIDKMDWAGLFRFCQEQAIVGVVFEKIEKLKNERIEIPREVLLSWFALSEQIKQRNILLNKRCVELTEMLKKDALLCCILKGQSNTVIYPNPYSRTSGDIDIFVLPDGYHGIKERRKLVKDYIKRRFPKTRIRYQHIDFPIFSDVEVEVHFIPTAKNNPVYNWRIQQWVEERIREQCANKVSLPDGIGQIPVPTSEFNIVYQLSHMMHHYFDEGIGLRQFIDYYYLLKYAGRGKMNEVRDTLEYLNLYKFAGAVMYVMREVFALEEQYMIAPVDESRGKTLLNEILKGGNFGRSSRLPQLSAGKKYLAKTWRSLHFVKEYPAEALCEPIFRTWHFFWRMGE